MVYRASHVRQADGSKLQWANCRMAVGATQLDFHTRGEKRSTGAEMRSFQSDQVGGTDADDLRKAWERGFGEVLVIRNGRYWDALVEDRNKGWFIGLDVWYPLMPVRCQEGSFGHTIGIAPETNWQGLWLVSDPLCFGYKWMDPIGLRLAATEWSRRVLGGAPRRTLGEALGTTETPVSPPSGTIPHPPETGGAESPNLPLYFTTSEIGVDVSGLMFKPVRSVDGIFTYTRDAHNIKVSDRSYVPVHVGDSRPAVAEVLITDPDMFTGATAYLAPQGDESVVMLASRGTFVPTALPGSDAIIAERDRQWREHLTPER